MSQIKAKQLKLNNQGDLIVGANNGNGSILPKGNDKQALYVNESVSSVQWKWVNEIRTSASGNLVLLGTSNVQDPTNYITVYAAGSGSSPVVAAEGTNTNISITLQPKGTGEILAPVGYTTNIQSNNALVTKEYVDIAITGLDWKNSVRVATTDPAELSGFVYNPVNEPSGLVWTNVTSPVFDGITINDGDRVLIKNASDQRGNGLFYYDSGNSAFIRTEDANNVGSTSEVSDGLAVFVEEGSVNNSTGWVLTQPNGTATLGTDNLVFTQFAGTNIYVAGSGLSLTGNIFSVNESSTIGVVSDNVIVKSNNVQGNVLISTGNANGEATWGALDLSNNNSVTGILNVQFGGTGLSSVPEGYLLVGGPSTSSLSTIAPTPATTSSQVYVLQTNVSGDNVLFGTISLNQISDVSAPSPTQNQVLLFDGTQWIATSSDSLVSSEDKFVKITSNDDTASYLDDKLVVAASGALTKTILSAGAGERLELSVNYDNTTIITDSNNLSVGGGTSAQVLVGQGVNAPAAWLSPLSADNDFTLIYDKDLGRVHYRRFGEIEQIEVVGDSLISTNTFKGARLVFTNGDSIGVRGTIGGSAINIEHNLVLTSSLYTSVTADPADKLVFFDLSNNHIPNYMEIGTFLSNYNVMSVTGSGLVVSIDGSGVTRNVVANTSGDRAGIEIINGNGQNGDITIGLDIENLTTATSSDPSDFILAYRSSSDQNIKISINDILTSDVSSNYKWFGITNGTDTIYPDAIQDTLTVQGSGISVVLTPASDTIELSFDIPSLPQIGITSARNLNEINLVVFDSATSTHYKMNYTDAVSQTYETYASANATGGVNESFTNFFVDTNVHDESTVVYVNGIALKQDGWTRTGTTLTLIDSVNGYSTDPGDVITAYYRLT